MLSLVIFISYDTVLLTESVAFSYYKFNVKVFGEVYLVVYQVMK
jgi:hypothetical protein